MLTIWTGRGEKKEKVSMHACVQAFFASTKAPQHGTTPSIIIIIFFSLLIPRQLTSETTTTTLGGSCPQVHNTKKKPAKLLLVEERRDNRTCEAQPANKMHELSETLLSEAKDLLVIFNVDSDLLINISHLLLACRATVRELLVLLLYAFHRGSTWW